ncbi:MAG: hypothetical protein ACYC28_05985 [Longimicrobiales bacterium]
MDTDNNDSIRVYALGRLGFSVSGTDPILPYIQSELQPLEVKEGSADVRVHFVFTPHLPELHEPVIMSPVSVSRDALLTTHGGLTYHLSGSPPDLRVHLRSNSTFATERFAPDWLLRTSSSNFLLRSEKVAKNFMYNVFDFVTQLANVTLGQSYIHASSFARDGRAVALVAWGGVGKTSALLKLVGSGGWRFLSDDLGLIDDTGTAWRTPKRLQIYGYNVRGEPDTYRALMSRRNLVDRIAWHVRERTAGSKRVRRRTSAEELFGAENTGSHAELTDLFFMERADVSQFTVEPIETHELARRAARTIVRETQPLHELMTAVYSSGLHPALPTPEEFYNGTFETLLRCLEGQPSRLVRVPLRAGPEELARLIAKHVDSTS